MTPVNGTIDAHRRPSRATADAAADRIAERRARVDDPDLSLMPDNGLDLAAYVYVRHSVSRATLAADVLDAWTILDHIGPEVDRIRLGLLRLAHDHLGITYRELAPMCGVVTRQGVEALVRRLEAAADGLPKDAHYARQAATQRRHEESEADRLARLAAHFAGFLTNHLRNAETELPGDLEEDLEELRAATVNVKPRVLVARARLLLEELGESHADWLAERPQLRAELDEYRTLLRPRREEP